MSFELLKSALGKRLAHLNLKGYADAAEICARANRLIVELMPKLAGRVRAKYVKGETLTLAVTSSSVSQEISLKQAKILSELKKQFRTIKKLRYQVEKIEDVTRW